MKILLRISTAEGASVTNLLVLFVARKIVGMFAHACNNLRITTTKLVLKLQNIFVIMNNSNIYYLRIFLPHLKIASYVIVLCYVVVCC